jgi:hypothetical protein
MMLTQSQENSSSSLPFVDNRNASPARKRILPHTTYLQIKAALHGGLAGIAGRRRPAIPYQAFNLTQTTTHNPKNG